MNKKSLNVFDKIKKYHVEYIDIESIVTNKFVKELRQKLNMTQTVFAEILGVTKKTIEKWEQGKNPVKGCSARLLYALNENPELINMFYVFEIIEPKNIQNDNSIKEITNEKHTTLINQKEFKLNNATFIKRNN